KKRKIPPKVDRRRVNKKNKTKRVECEEAQSSHANEQLQIVCWDPLTNQHNELDKKKRRIRPKVDCRPVVKNEVTERLQKFITDEMNGSDLNNLVLTSKWKQFVEENKDYLKELSMIQIWSFRKDQQLCFALAVVDRPPLYLMASNVVDRPPLYLMASNVGAEDRITQLMDGPVAAAQPRHRRRRKELKRNKNMMITLRLTLYYLDDIPREELLQAFPSTNYTHSRLGFSGNYSSLPDRDRIELGYGALNYAIINVYYGRSQPSALLVIIQMVAEAVRIRYIGHLILRNMYANLNFIPDSRAISLENKWSDLSQQIQWSGESRVFRREIQVQSALNAVVPIRNVEDSMSLAALALNNVVPSREMDGQCVNVKDSQYYNGNFIILGACGNAQRNQLWTFKSDGTIRSNGKCLTSGYGGWGAYIMIFDCDIMPEAATNSSGFFIMLIDGHESLDSIILLKCQGWGNQRWADGTILHPNARLVMDVWSSDVSLQDIILYQLQGILTKNGWHSNAYGFHSMHARI
nr:preproricin [Tanacetum cinerariifolium]